MDKVLLGVSAVCEIDTVQADWSHNILRKCTQWSKKLWHLLTNISTTTTTTILRPLYSQPVLASTSSKELKDFVGAKFYLADGNQCIRFREKTLEFSSRVLSTLALYHILTSISPCNLISCNIIRLRSMPLRCFVTSMNCVSSFSYNDTVQQPPLNKSLFSAKTGTRQNENFVKFAFDKDTESGVGQQCCASCYFYASLH